MLITVISHGVSPFHHGIAPTSWNPSHFPHCSHSSMPNRLRNTQCEPGCPSFHWFPPSHLSLRRGWEVIPRLRSHWQWVTLQHGLSPPLSITVAHFCVNFHTQLSTWKHELNICTITSPLYIRIPQQNTQFMSTDCIRNWAHLFI